MESGDNKIKYFLYARKSSESEDKQMASIESQIKELNQLAKQENLKIVEVFSESKSAKAPGREVFEKMIARLKKGEASGIICWKLNRLARNPIDGGEISWMVQQGIIQHIQTFGRSYYPTDNVIVMAVELGMANQFIRDLSVDTKRGLKNKAESGWYPAPAPLGYINTPDRKKGMRVIDKDPERFDLVRKMFDLMLTGAYTPPKILEIAANEWKLKNIKGQEIARSSVYRMFIDPFYYGEYEYPKNSGNWYIGKHEPMITKDEYDLIQSLLGRHGKPRPIKREFAFTGLITCGECGAAITAEFKTKIQKNGNIHHYKLYHCTKRKKTTIKCSQGSIEQAILEEQISEVLRTIEIPKSFKDWALDWIKEENRKESKDRNKIVGFRQRQYQLCLKKIDRLIDMRANDEIDEAEFKRKRFELEREKRGLNEMLNDCDKRIDDWLKDVSLLFEFAESARFRFETGDLNTKKEILAALGSNLTLKDKKLFIKTQKPLLQVKEAALEVRAIYQRFEPAKNGLDKAKINTVFAQNPILLRGSDSNRRPSD